MMLGRKKPPPAPHLVVIYAARHPGALKQAAVCFQLDGFTGRTYDSCKFSVLEKEGGGQ